MQTFEKTITVSKDDLDHLNHVNNVRYVQWVQDIAEAHWLQNTSEEIRRDYFWVLLEHHIKYKGEALLNDKLNLKTFVSKAEGVSSIRHVEITNTSNNKLILTSETKWCFMSATAKKPARIFPEIAALFN